ncbi:DinB family protein [Chitinophaga niastensis]|uniref:DinB family protein n=1 Tax=Chitinophaga niastensis TaxID=536980 RepID=A0A2P8H8R3_CHINA|nr:DinB family protein [Chitinophaga niastensis]PSL42626.1 DinB family protein [Chitinophaga niastensis]
MKKLCLLLAIAAFSSFTAPKHVILREDRTLLITLLQQTKDSLLKDIAGLTDAQLEYKPAPDRWSIIECVEHITLVEKTFMDMEQGLMKQPANPERRKDIKVTDESLLKKMEDRSHKAKAPEFGIPKHSYSSDAEAIKNFTEQRDKLIDYVTNTPDELRNHITDNPIFGTMDGYQLLLLDAGHTNRHTQQLEEVKADAGFPK